MPTGKIKMFNEERGFGFIKPDDGGDDVFFHVTALRDGDEIAKEKTVSYDLGSTPSLDRVKTRRRDGGLIDAVHRPCRFRPLALHQRNDALLGELSSFSYRQKNQRDEQTLRVIRNIAPGVRVQGHPILHGAMSHLPLMPKRCTRAPPASGEERPQGSWQ